ncbi:MAG: SpoIIE family protein phosphatase [Armatimonadota bacterium]
MERFIRRRSIGARLVLVLLAAVIITSLAVTAVLMRSEIGWVVAWTLVSIVFFLLVGYILILKIIRPLDRLRRSAEAIGAGDLAQRVSVHTGDELEELADAVNDMAEKLQVSYSQLEEEHGLAVAAAQEASILYSVSQALVSTIKLKDRLTIIAESIASVCNAAKSMIWLLEDSHLVPYAYFGLSSEEEQTFAEWEMHLEELPPIVRQSFRGERAISVRDAEKDERIPEEVAEAFDMRSILVIPFIFEDSAIGYALTYDPGKIRVFSAHQKSLAQAVAAQAAVAIQNALAYERERRISETLQRSLLPAVPARIGGFDIADKYAPALSEAEVGGDFYDLIRVSPSKTALVIADISGKGLSAAVHTALVKYTLRAFAAADDDPAIVIAKLNDAVYENVGEESFITLFYGLLDVEAKELVYVNAGHELPLLYGEERRICMTLESTGLALGITPGREYAKRRIEFVPGDVLLLYTDGATEARSDGRFLGIEGLEEMFCSIAGRDVHAIVEGLDRRLHEYSGGALRDDVALMAVKYRRRP